MGRKRIVTPESVGQAIANIAARHRVPYVDEIAAELGISLQRMTHYVQEYRSLGFEIPRRKRGRPKWHETPARSAAHRDQRVLPRGNHP